MNPLRRSGSLDVGFAHDLNRAVASAIEQNGDISGGPIVIDGMRIPRGEQPESYLPLFRAALSHELSETNSLKGLVVRTELPPTDSHRQAEFRPGRRDALVRKGAFRILVGHEATLGGETI